jgi:hypothetical protein
MLSHYLNQVRDPANVPENTAKRIMGMDMKDLASCQNSFIENVTHSKNIATALFMRVIKDGDIEHKLRKELEAQAAQVAQSKALNAKCCAQEKRLKAFRNEVADIDKRIAELASSNQKLDVLEISCFY